MIRGKLELTDLAADDLRGRPVLVRVDYNVPLDDGRVVDDLRIRATLPTLERLMEAGARPVLLSHFGRPKGRPDPAFSIRPVAEHLTTLVPWRVRFVPGVVGPAARVLVDQLVDGELALLENTRFHPGEEANDPELGRQWAQLGEVFINDAFGAAHRAHASVVAVAEAMKARGKPAVAGLLLAKELTYLGDALERPRRPFVAVLGGAKISGKIDVIEALRPRVDRLLIGGAMANTFFRAMGLATGRSLVEEDRVPLARRLLDEMGDQLVLPRDVVVASDPDAETSARVVPRKAIPEDAMALDVGPETVADFVALTANAGTVFWNGPLGMFERPAFRAGTAGLARALAEAAARGVVVVVGGGDSAAALAELGLVDRMTHVSTGGGAALEFLEGKELPGVAALSDAATA